MKEVRKLPKIFADDHLATLRSCGGYYVCPKSADGKRLGPLVGYAGKYSADDGSMHHFVGDVYYNFASAEQYSMVLEWFARALAKCIKASVDVFDGSPMGGIFLTGALGRATGIRTIFAEKKVTAVATEGKREESRLVIERHEIWPNDRVAIVEDVCNNFSTTNEQIKLITGLGGKVTGVVCFLNRSSHTVVPETEIPVWSLLHIPTVQYRQSDPAVIADIKTGNVVWEPKPNWPVLAEAMEVASKLPKDPLRRFSRRPVSVENQLTIFRKPPDS